MDREKIERLAMDSAAGELNEDVEALLQEYLAEHSQAKKWFLEMQDFYSKTQAAFNSKTSSIKQPEEYKPSIKFSMFPVMRWAAVIIIAVCIGAAAGRWTKQDVPAQKPKYVEVISTPTAKKSGFNLDNFGEGFWRNKITAMMNPSPSKIHRAKISGPSLLEQYRQYLKEKNHE